MSALSHGSCFLGCLGNWVLFWEEPWGKAYSALPSPCYCMLTMTIEVCVHACVCACVCVNASACVCSYVCVHLQSYSVLQKAWDKPCSRTCAHKWLLICMCSGVGHTKQKHVKRMSCVFRERSVTPATKSRGSSQGCNSESYLDIQILLWAQYVPSNIFVHLEPVNATLFEKCLCR